MDGTYLKTLETDMQKWKDDAACLGMDTNIFFEKYEEQKDLAASVDRLCQRCSVNSRCFAVGVSGKEWGVHGGIYLKDGMIDKEHNSHKEKNDWFEVWQSLTMEKE